MASKRALDGSGDPNSKKTKTDDDMFDQRVLVDNQEASVIIGRGGSNVKHLRTETSCFLSLLKHEVPGARERVLAVKGHVENIAKALQLIVQLLLEAANQKKQGAPDETFTIKLLVHKFQSGAILGKGGAIIKEIQSETGARIQLSNDTLGNSTEKSASLTGTPEVIHAAALRVLSQLKANPLRPSMSSILYVPGPAIAPPFPGAPGAAPVPYQVPMHYQPPGPYAHYPPPPPHPQQNQPTKTEKIVIPTVCAGTVIGKGGSIISDIKSQTGTVITIADPEPTALGDRVVSITGTSQGILAAINLIRQRVESYQPPAQSYS